MTNEQRQALRDSIRHWKKNEEYFHTLANEGKRVSLKEAPIFGEDCACCQITVLEGECVGCPIYAYTELGECSGTPWYSVYSAVCAGEMQEAARNSADMREWMEGLLEGKAQPVEQPLIKKEEAP